VREAAMEVVIKAVGVGSGKEVKHLLNEWAILSKLAHENIVEVYRYGKEVALPERPGNFCLLAQEHARHGNLLEVIKGGRLSVAHRRFLFGEVGQALQHLHSNSIVHRDIKLDNILIFDHEDNTGLTAKLADFGFASMLRSDQTTLNSFKGTRRGYMAPEIHASREDPNNYYDPKAADVFALGVVLFALVLGRLPFEFALPSDKLYSHIAEGRMKEFWAAHAAAVGKLESEEDSLAAEFRELFENLVTI
jgi:serine/threonine protein kinase